MAQSNQRSAFEVAGGDCEAALRAETQKFKKTTLAFFGTTVILACLAINLHMKDSGSTPPVTPVTEATNTNFDMRSADQGYNYAKVDDAVSNEHISFEEANMFLSVLEMLKDDPSNETLKVEYRNLIGDVEWVSAKEEASLSQESMHEQVIGNTELNVHRPLGTPLGQMSTPGEEFNIVELLNGIAKKMGRYVTHRRDFMIETKAGEPKFVIDGTFFSMHSRMYILDKNAIKRYVVRRSFNYLNPVAQVFGQYSYRVIQCEGEKKQLYYGDQCNEGDTLFTITKDRLGRGLLWGRHEYRVFAGFGGCKKWSSGLFSCNKEKQVMYSFSSGVTHGFSYDNIYYQGPIRTMAGSGHAAYLYTKDEMGVDRVADRVELQNNFEVAVSQKVAGAPRALNWAAKYLGVLKVVKVVKSISWADSYHLKFSKPTDELLIFILQAVQDLTRDHNEGVR